MGSRLLALPGRLQATKPVPRACKGSGRLIQHRARPPSPGGLRVTAAPDLLSQPQPGLPLAPPLPAAPLAAAHKSIPHGSARRLPATGDAGEGGREARRSTTAAPPRRTHAGFTQCGGRRARRFPPQPLLCRPRRREGVGTQRPFRQLPAGQLRSRCPLRCANGRQSTWAAAQPPGCPQRARALLAPASGRKRARRNRREERAAARPPAGKREAGAAAAGRSSRAGAAAVGGGARPL